MVAAPNPKQHLIGIERGGMDDAHAAALAKDGVRQVMPAAKHCIGPDISFSLRAGFGFGFGTMAIPTLPEWPLLDKA
jgi:hypothetical protein